MESAAEFVAEAIITDTRSSTDGCWNHLVVAPLVPTRHNIWVWFPSNRFESPWHTIVQVLHVRELFQWFRGRHSGSLL